MLPPDGFSGKEHLSLPTVCSVETQKGLGEDDCDIDIDVDGDDDNCGNPLMPGELSTIYLFCDLLEGHKQLI